MRGLGSHNNLVKKYVISRIFILGTIISVSILILIFQPTARAEQFSWLGDSQPTVESRANTPILSTACNTTEKKIIGLNETRSVCIQSNGNFNFATFNHTGPIFKGAVSFGYEKDMYLISDGMCGGYYNDCQYIPDKDMMVSRYYFDGPNFKNGFAIFKNFSKKLTQTKNIFGQVTGYNFPMQNTSPDFYISDVNFRDYQVSKNGNWIVAELKNQGVLRISTDDFNIKRFTNQHNNYSVGAESYMEFSISDDGDWVAVVGWNTEERIYKIDDLCGLVVNSNNIMEDNSYEQCPSRDIRGMLGDRINGLSTMSLPNLSDDGGELQLYIGYYDRTKNETISLQAPGYIAPRLDYLALGDSYSSGEGDTELTSSGQKHYLAFTDVNGDYAQGIPREKCHQSWRAYPFLLADSYGIADDKKETVACSGAKIEDISATGEYEGQGARLKGVVNINSLQNDALENFIPGRVRQLKFVEMYQPKTITLQISGNDMGFANIILSCVAKLDINHTCDYASKDYDKGNLGKAIAAQYDHLAMLFERIHKASPGSKIYAISYPKFVSTGSSCGDNVRLSEEERRMAERSVEYLNSVIEKASIKAGVTYVKIEDSLNGKRLCDTSRPYVTGIAGGLYNGMNTSERQESFHPNANGHNLIANSIKNFFTEKNSDLLSYTHCTPVDRKSVV